MIKKTRLQKIGASSGFVVPEAILEQINLKEGDELLIATQGRSIILMRASTQAARTAGLLDSIFDRLDDALAALED